MGYYISKRGHKLRADGEIYEYGDRIPDELAEVESPSVLEYREEKEPPSDEDLLDMLEQSGSWYTLPDGSKVQGEEAALKVARRFAQEEGE